jgi:hypothetical protein
MNRLSRVNEAFCGYELTVMDRKGGTPAWGSGEQQETPQTEERTSLFENFTPNLRICLYNHDNDLPGYVKDGQHPEQLSKYYLPKRVSAHC